jgi:hypothetical protein
MKKKSQAMALLNNLLVWMCVLAVLLSSSLLGCGVVDGFQHGPVHILAGIVNNKYLGGGVATTASPPSSTTGTTTTTTRLFGSKIRIRKADRVSVGNIPRKIKRTIQGVHFNSSVFHAKVLTAEVDAYLQSMFEKRVWKTAMKHVEQGARALQETMPPGFGRPAPAPENATATANNSSSTTSGEDDVVAEAKTEEEVEEKVGGTAEAEVEEIAAGEEERNSIND